MGNRFLVAVVYLLVACVPASAQTVLTVISGQPTGELGDLAQANEIRVRFSEAMVPVGRIPDQVTAPFFSIRPEVAGTFRWAGPTILIFTPDPKVRLPRATRYEVTVDATATAVSGRKLPRAYTFTFTTPPVRLLETDWYRTNGRFDQPVIIPLRFNQPVRPADVLAHVSLRYEPHDWSAPTASPAQRLR